MVTFNAGNVHQTTPFESVAKKDQKPSSTISIYNIKELNVSTFQSLANISAYVINMVEKNHVSKTENALVVAIKYKLDAEISKYDTSGFLNFFKYLFQPSAKKQMRIQFEGMQALQKLIENVKIADPKTKPLTPKKMQATEASHLHTLQSKKGTDSQKIPSQPLQKKLPLQPLPPNLMQDLFSAIEEKRESLSKATKQSPKSVEQSIKTTDSSPVTLKKVTVIAQPLMPETSKTVDVQTIDKTPKTLQVEVSVLSNVSVDQQPSIESDLIPTPPIPLPPIPNALNSGPKPPPMPIKFNSAPSLLGLGIQKKVVSFQNEPKEPTIDLKASAAVVGVAKLKEEIAEMQSFVTHMKNALDPIEAATKREEELESMLKEKQALVLPLAKEIEKEIKKLAILENDKPVTKVKLQVKKDEFKEIPLYSQEKFEEINAILDKAGAELLPTQYLKSEYQQIIEGNKKRLEKEKEDLDQAIQKIESELKAIRSTENNGIAFKGFADTLKKKKLILSRWNSGMNLRKKQLANILQPKPKVEVEAAQPKKPKLNKAIMSENLIEKYPDLESIVALYQDSSALILMNGKNYHENLVV